MEIPREKVERWLNIKRGKESYGQGTTGQQGAAFYKDHLQAAVMASALERFKHKDLQVDLLVSIAGFSPMTSILSCHILKPAQVYLLSSRQAEDCMEEVLQWLFNPRGGGFSYKNVHHRSCPPTDTMRIYQLIKDRVQELPQENPRVVIDITGGKKVMSAVAAMCAWQLDLKLSYIESNFDAELRMPRPGGEHLLLIENPSTLFGDAELTSLSTLADEGAFEAAAIGMERLESRINNPWPARLRGQICHLYSAWSNLDLEKIGKARATLSQTLQSRSDGLNHNQVQRLKAQLEFLQRLHQELNATETPAGDKIEVLLCYYLLGRYYERLSRLDFAALLFYRAAEGCMTSHLARSYPGLQLREVDPKVFGDQGLDVDELRNTFCNLARDIFQDSDHQQLPTRLGFITSAMLLYSLPEDKLLPGAHIKDKKALMHMRQQSNTRNDSILAHGFKVIEQKSLNELKNLAWRLLSSFWSLHRPTDDLEDSVKHLTFVELSHNATH